MWRPNQPIVSGEAEASPLPTPRSPAPRSPLPGPRIVAFVLGAVLLSATVLKGYDLAARPVVDDAMLAARWFWLALVPAEAVLGLWLLLFGFAARWVWKLCLACFSAFAWVSAWKAFSGEASCQCFGNLSVSPWWTLWLDLSSLTVLWVTRPNAPLGPATDAGTAIRLEETRHRGAFQRQWVWLCIFPLAMVTGLYQVFAHVGWTGDGAIVVDHRQWVGKSLPLARDIDIWPEIRQGAWLLLFHRHDCPVCRDAIADLTAASRSALEVGELRVAIVEIPPFRTTVPQIVDGPLLHGRLTSRTNYVMRTPVLVELRDGYVESVVAGDESRSRLRAILSRETELSVNAGRRAKIGRPETHVVATHWLNLVRPKCRPVQMKGAELFCAFDLHLFHFLERS